MLGIGAIELSRQPGLGQSDADQARHEERSITRGATRATADEAAALFEAYGDRIRRYVAFRVRSIEDAEDLSSEVFRRVLSGPIPTDIGARPAWLFRVAHNAVVDHYRRRRFLAPLENILDRPDDAPTLPERAIRDEQVRRIDEALATLGGKQRAAIYLRFYEDLEYADVATVMGIPSVTARSLVHRGLKKLAVELGGLGLELDR
jgi:RNA polymerase sigma-70 factor (ECF subfamily)